MCFSLSAPGRKSAYVQCSSLENQTLSVRAMLYIFSETCKRPLKQFNRFGQWRNSPTTCTVRISYVIREAWRNTVLNSWWKQETWPCRGLWHFWGCRVAGEKGRLTSFSTFLCMPPLQVQIHSYTFFFFFFIYARSLLHRSCNWTASPLAASTGTSRTVVTTCSSAVFTCGCGYAYWCVFPQRKTASKARAYFSGNVALEVKEIKDHFSPKWLISPNLQFCRNIFKLESRQLKQSTFLPAGYANAKIDPLCIRMLIYLDVTEMKELN